MRERTVVVVVVVAAAVAVAVAVAVDRGWHKIWRLLSPSLLLPCSMEADTKACLIAHSLTKQCLVALTPSRPRSPCRMHPQPHDRIASSCIDTLTPRLPDSQYLSQVVRDVV